MAKVDMHVHSSYSARPSEWFLQRLGARESYTDTETIYREALRSGMDFVTVTDHNEIAGSLRLKEKYPERVFTGVETTTYFPENGCKIHVLIYGLDEAQFAVIEKIRTDIYDLREYIREQDLAHSVAHATYAINKRLSLGYLEKLFLLFNCFEGINGSRSRIANDILMDALAELTPERIESLRRKHGIEPLGDTPWVKGITGGTDDHSGLFIGKTYTELEAATPGEYVEQFKLKQSCPGGRHNNYQGLAFALYKIAYDFSQAQSTPISSSLFGSINRLIFEQKSIGLKNKLVMQKMKYAKGNGGNTIQRLIVDLVEAFQKNNDMPVDDKLRLLYDKISEIADCLFKMLIMEIENNLQQGNLLGLIQKISGSIPGIFLSIPFFTTMDLLHESRDLLDEIAAAYGSSKNHKRRRVLWFTDYADDLEKRQNLWGDFEDTILKEKCDLIIVGCSNGNAGAGSFQHGFLNLPNVHSYSPAFLPSSTIHFPSVLSSIKIISEADPDQIVVATPGPVGFIGMLASRLLHVQCSGMYTMEMKQKIVSSVGDEDISRLTESFIRWFFSLTGRIIVPDRDCADSLVRGGYDREKLIVFTEGDTNVRPLDPLPGALPEPLAV